MHEKELLRNFFLVQKYQQCLASHINITMFFLQRLKNRHNLHHYHVHHAARQELVSTVRTGSRQKLAGEKRRRAENARKAKSMAEVLKENEDLKKAANKHYDELAEMDFKQNEMRVKLLCSAQCTQHSALYTAEYP